MAAKDLGLRCQFRSLARRIGFGAAFKSRPNPKPNKVSPLKPVVIESEGAICPRVAKIAITRAEWAHLKGPDRLGRDRHRRPMASVALLKPWLGIHLESGTPPTWSMMVGAEILCS